MRTAMVRGVETDAATFGRENGPDYRETGATPYCKGCREEVQPYGLHTTGSVRRFDHADRPDGADPLDDCVFARRTARFAGMEPRGFDEDAGRRLRDGFFEDGALAANYAFCLALCRRGNLPTTKFREIVSRADRKRVWSYVGMTSWLLPYALLTLADFASTSRVGEPYHFHFVFEPPRGGGPSAVLDRPDRCTLLKVFRGGEPVAAADNPLQVSEEAFVATAGDASWVSPALLARLGGRQGVAGPATRPGNP